MRGNKNEPKSKVGDRKNRVKERGVSVSDMKLSARVSAGQASSHPPPGRTNANRWVGGWGPVLI